MLHRLILKVTKFQYNPPKRLTTVGKNILWAIMPPMSNRVNASNDNQLRSLLETIRVFSTDIGIKFGLDKCRKSTILKGKCSKTEGIQLIYEENIKELNNVEFCKYLEIQESDLICHATTKSQRTEE